MYLRSVLPACCLLAVVLAMQLPSRVAGDDREDPVRARLHRLFDDPTVGVIVAERKTEVTFARDDAGALYPVYLRDRPHVETTSFHKATAGQAATAHIRLTDLTRGLDAILRYRDLLAPWLDLIRTEARARDIPAELVLLTLGTEAEYGAIAPIAGIEDWALGLPGVSHLRDASVPINLKGGRRPLWSSTLGIAQIAPRTVRELVSKGYIAGDFEAFRRRRGAPAHANAGDARRAFETYVAYALSNEHAIRAHVAYLQMVADEVGLTSAERRQTLPMMQLMFAHYHSRPHTRFEGFHDPMHVLQLAFEEYDTASYPRHARFRGYGALLAPASTTLMAGLSVALDLDTVFEIRSVVDLRP